MVKNYSRAITLTGSQEGKKINQETGFRDKNFLKDDVRTDIEVETKSRTYDQFCRDKEKSTAIGIVKSVKNYIIVTFYQNYSRFVYFL